MGSGQTVNHPYWLLVAHLVGDYLLQSDWMASEKTKKSTACLAHVATYILPFVFVTQSLMALALIGGTHFVIDRFRLARFVCWAKNFLSPNSMKMVAVKEPIERMVAMPEWWHPWADCSATGYHKDRPLFLSLWLMIIADNTMHLICNGLAITLLG